MSQEETTDPYYSLENDGTIDTANTTTTTTTINNNNRDNSHNNATITDEMKYHEKQDLENRILDTSLTVSGLELEPEHDTTTTNIGVHGSGNENYEEPLLPNSSYTIQRKEEQEESHNTKSLFITLGAASALFLMLLTSSIIKQPSSSIIPDDRHDISPDSHDGDGDDNKPFDQSNLKDRCNEYFYPQRLDHFGESTTDTFLQRYFICDEDWKRATPSTSANANANSNSIKDEDTTAANSKTTTQSGPIFFYLGNEANVELYLSHSGLMWENAKPFGAMLVFAEHRYFGQSIPTTATTLTTDTGEELDMSYLSSEQALADYASLITYLKHEKEVDAMYSPVIGFGGSYGGMLASWFRMKYPHIIDGVIAGSAPILSFLGDDLQDDFMNEEEAVEDGELDSGGYARVMSFDASSEAGAAPNCQSNIRSVWSILQEYGSTPEGRETVSTSLQLCDPLESVDEIDDLKEWIKDAYSSMSMGNYPYPSSYLLDGDGMLDAYPMRGACEPLQEPNMVNDPKVLLDGIRQSIATFYNATGESLCLDRGSAVNNSTQNDVNFWGYLYCTEMSMPFSTDGVNDMFWKEDMNWTATVEGCQEEWGVTPQLNWASIFYGGKKALETASNIVFSNGNYDPWSPYGVLPDMKQVVDNPNIVSIMIDGGAHHLDLMFSHPDDPASVIEARKVELDEIRKWIAAASTSGGK